MLGQSCCSLSLRPRTRSNQIWENMQELWQEEDLREEAESNPDFAGQMVGYAYMQRKSSVEMWLDQDVLSASGGRGEPLLGRYGQTPDGKRYGKGKNPVHLHGVKPVNCPNADKEAADGGFPQRDPHPSALEVL